MTDRLASYWRERFRPLVFAPIALGISAAAQLGTAFEWGRYATDCALALFLLAQFRLWDDIADVERDRVQHPQRVMVRARALGPYVATCYLLAGLNVLLVLSVRGVAAATILAALDFAFAMFYATRPSTRRPAVDVIVLLKYPVFIVTLASDVSFGVVSVASAVFALACAYEVWHTGPRSVRTEPDPSPRNVRPQPDHPARMPL